MPSNRTPHAIVPGSRIDRALGITTRRERRNLLAVMAQRMPAAAFVHVRDADTGLLITKVTKWRSPKSPTRRQRKWRARLERSLAQRGVSL